MYEAMDQVTVLQQRQWIRLTHDCNQRCVFCLDADQHHGAFRTRAEVEQELREGLAKGCERVILSGGEPTIHPEFAWFVRRAAALGYRRVQTVTNGRMFSDPKFVWRAIKAGLHEVTFSMHGHTPQLHDALVAVEGAFAEACQGIRHALASRRLIVSVDIVINRRNVFHVRDIVRHFADLGVGEFDLMIMIPFGRGNPASPSTIGGTWGEVQLAKKLLLCRDEVCEVLPAVMEFARARGLVVWTNRLPAHYLEGYEHLIQNPKKFYDEVNGRRHEMQAAIAGEHWMPCWDERCPHCFLDRCCARLRTHRDERREGFVAHGSWDLAWGTLPTDMPVGRLTVEGESLDVILDAVDAAPARGARAVPLDALPRAAPTAEALARLAARGAGRIVARTPAVVRALLDDAPAGLARAVVLSPETLAAMEGPRPPHESAPAGPARPACAEGATGSELPLRGVAILRDDLFNPDHGAQPVTLSEALPALAARGTVLEGFPPCLAPGAAHVAYEEPWPLGLPRAEGGWNLPRAVEGYLHHHYHVYAARCKTCGARPDCPGLPVQYVRVRGFKELDPSRFPPLRAPFIPPRATPPEPLGAPVSAGCGSAEQAPV